MDFFCIFGWCVAVVRCVCSFVYNVHALTSDHFTFELRKWEKTEQNQWSHTLQATNTLNEITLFKVGELEKIQASSQDWFYVYEWFCALEIVLTHIYILNIQNDLQNVER